MKDYYKKNADKAEKQLKLLVPGFEIKVKEIGLNQIKEIDRSWFENEKIADMFFARLDILKNIAK